jgi:peptidyl-prolyl cis-trans isomerase SurA
MRCDSKVLPSPPCSLAAPFALAAAGCGCHPLSDTGVLLDRIIALVDDGVVLQSELDAQLEMISRQLREQGTRMPPREVLRQQVLESLILQQVQLQRAERIGYPHQRRAAQPGPAAGRGATASASPSCRGPGGRRRGLLDVPRATAQGTGDRLAAAARRRGAHRVSRAGNPAGSSSESTRGSQIDYDISQILVALPPDPSPEQVLAAEGRVRDMHARLQAGGDFAELAVAESEGQQALSGGSLGWRRGSQLPQQFAGVIQGAREGEFSAPIRSSSGFHIFRLNDTRGGDDTVIQWQSKARHILMMPNEVLDDDAVRGRLEAIRERILAGESFADIAMLESDDPARRRAAATWAGTRRGPSCRSSRRRSRC